MDQREIYLRSLRTEYHLTQRCACCGVPVDPTKFDDLPLKEWFISAMCQRCQDEVFNEEE